MEPIVPAQVAFDAGALEGLLQGVRGEHTEDDGHAGVARDGRHPLADLRHHHIEMGGVATDDGSQGDHHLITAAGGKPLGQQGNLKTAGHPGHIQLGAGGGGVDAVAGKAIEATAQQFAGDQVIEPGNDNRQAQTCRVGEPTFEDGQGIRPRGNSRPS